MDVGIKPLGSPHGHPHRPQGSSILTNASPSSHTIHAADRDRGSTEKSSKSSGRARGTEGYSPQTGMGHPRASSFTGRRRATRRACVERRGQEGGRCGHLQATVWCYKEVRFGGFRGNCRRQPTGAILLVRTKSGCTRKYPQPTSAHAPPGAGEDRRDRAWEGSAGGCVRPGQGVRAAVSGPGTLGKGAPCTVSPKAHVDTCQRALAATVKSFIF